MGALVHRSGKVDYVIVGDAGKLQLPDVGRLRAAEGRFRGLRLIHTHLRNEPLTRDDLVDLVRLRLDLVAAIQLTSDGQPGQVVYAHNVPRSQGGDEPSHREVGPIRFDKLDVDFGNLVSGLESEFARLARTRAVSAKDGRAILVHVSEKGGEPSGDSTRRFGRRSDHPANVRELGELARTAGVEVVDVVVQHREKLDPKYVLGRGKLDDLLIRAMQLDAETLIFDRELSAGQAAALAAHTDLKIVDRTQLILDIFAQRAESKDGKLQVELAQLKYALPRLGQKDDALSRLTGGIGGRGPGETTLEIGKRRAKERVHHLEQQVKALAKQREQRRRRRGRGDVRVVAIVGYTNAGKSTLLNTLTGSAVLAEDKLFATLDTRSRRLHIPSDASSTQGDEHALPEDAAAATRWRSGEDVILVDTVGFIRALPEDLFAAFRATFEEAADADLILHVVDASDPARDDHIGTTERVLAELGLERRPRLLLFNKADLLGAGEGARLLREHRDAVLVSATSKEGVYRLQRSIAKGLRNVAASTPTKGSPDAAADLEAFVVDGAMIAPAWSEVW